MKSTIPRFSTGWSTRDLNIAPGEGPPIDKNALVRPIFALGRFFAIGVRNGRVLGKEVFIEYNPVKLVLGRTVGLIFESKI